MTPRRLSDAELEEELERRREARELERRSDGPPPDNGERRRARDREEDWRLRRDKLLFSIGAAGVSVITAAALLLELKNVEIVLGLLTVFGGLLGAPFVFGLGDRARDRQNGH